MYTTLCILPISFSHQCLFIFTYATLDIRDILDTRDIHASGALAKFTFSGDSDDSKPVTVEVGMTEADFSGAKLGASGAIILAAWLQRKVESHN